MLSAISHSHYFILDIYRGEDARENLTVRAITNRLFVLWRDDNLCERIRWRNEMSEPKSNMAAAASDDTPRIKFSPLSRVLMCMCGAALFVNAFCRIIGSAALFRGRALIIRRKAVTQINVFTAFLFLKLSFTGNDLFCVI